MSLTFRLHCAKFQSLSMINNTAIYNLVQIATDREKLYLVLNHLRPESWKTYIFVKKPKILENTTIKIKRVIWFCISLNFLSYILFTMDIRHNISEQNRKLILLLYMDAISFISNTGCGLQSLIRIFLQRN